MTNALQDHIDRVNRQDHQVFLGRLIWYTLSEVCIDHAEVVKGLTQVGLASQLPPAPKDYDVFRRVSSEAKLARVPTQADGVTENYLIREVAGRGEEVITKRIVCETRDTSNKKLSYNADLMDIEFNRNTGVLTNKILAPFLLGDIDNERQRRTSQVIFDKIRQDFLAWRGKLNAYAIREFIRAMLLTQFAATLVREGGGVYFVQESQAVNVDSLEKFVNAIPGASLHSLPLIDDRKQREMVRKAYEAETIDEIDKMMAEIQEIQRAGQTISSDRYARMLTKYQDLTAKTKSYGTMLEENLGEIGSRLGLFQTAVVRLTSQVKT